MDYEKAYKQLVEDFGAILNLNTVKESGVISVEDVRKLIPELAESEGERIRKELISFFKDRKSRLDRMEDILDPSNFPCDDYSLCEKAISWLEKQNEQKPANKVEPKFKVGDWVVFNNTHNSIYQVEKIENYQYTIRHILGGSMPLSYSSENMLRRWTIQDAKDGDVLSYRDGQWIFIYKGIVNEDTFKYYALLSEIGITVNDAAFSLLSSCITPATKEQRALLFQKMKEAGYEWDSEKKELKKIEHNAWSEEDEYLLDETIKHLESLIRITKKQGSAYSDEIQYYQRDIDWLKSLRSQSTWKPSEEHIHWLKWAINRMPDTEIANEAEAELRDLLEQLEKLMEE